MSRRHGNRMSPVMLHWLWIGRGLCLVCVLAACGGRTVASAEPNAGAESILTTDRPAAFPIGAMRRQGDKFVEVKLGKIVNPSRSALTFKVHYQNDQRQTYLGSFSPFPADQPGTFLVATQGQVNNGGAIVLTLVTPAVPPANGTAVQAFIEHVALVDAAPRGEPR
jgi:hypothetical protein